MHKNKIQALLVNHLLKKGQIELLLPDGVVLEIGTTQEDKDGSLRINENYCWVIAKNKDDRSVCIDSYNLGLNFTDDENMILFDDSFIDETGKKIRRVNVV
jgi:hypothetical protein